jgi:general secretion pathway protein G
MLGYGPPPPRELPRWVVRTAAAALWLFAGLLVVGGVLPRFLARSGSQRFAPVTTIGAMKSALKLYRHDIGRYPSTAEGLHALIEPPLSPPFTRGHPGPYLSDVKRIPLDPWGREFLYQSPGPKGAPFLITCLGADGRPGGTGDDADVTSAH